MYLRLESDWLRSWTFQPEAERLFMADVFAFSRSLYRQSVFLIDRGARSWALTLNLKDAHLRPAQRFMPA